MCQNTVVSLIIPYSTEARNDAYHSLVRVQRASENRCAPRGVYIHTTRGAFDHVREDTPLHSCRAMWEGAEGSHRATKAPKVRAFNLCEEVLFVAGGTPALLVSGSTASTTFAQTNQPLAAVLLTTNGVQGLAQQRENNQYPQRTWRNHAWR